jgi:predicted Zn finger-like uncharacterized protein
MDITCQHCQARFKLPDDKIPPGKAFALNCPKCKQTLTVNPGAPSPPASDRSLFDEVSSGSYDAAERPFDFLEEGAKTAIVCENDPEYQAKILAALKAMDYHVTQATSARDVLKQMRFHNFDLVVVNERFDSPDVDRNNVLRYLERLPMVTRRDMFVALVTERFRTMDNMAAFHKSVNLVVNLSNLDDMGKILQRGVSDSEGFYRVFKEALVRAGRA